jgi:hypothetical protein
MEFECGRPRSRGNRVATTTGVQYITKTVKTIRGMEARTRTKLEQEGWEFVSQTQGTVRSELTFRRLKPPMPWKLLGIGGGLVGLLITLSLVMSALGGKEEPTSSAEAASTPTASQATPTTSQVTPTEASTPSALTVTAAPVATPITVDELLAKLNSAKMGGMKVGDRFELTGELFESKYWMTGVNGEFVVMLKAQGGAQDLSVFVDKKKTAGWRDGEKVHMVVEMGEATMKGETTDGWLRVVSAEIVP